MTQTTSDTASSSAEDYAQITVETPMDAAWLRRFLADPEPLLRLNPYYEFRLFAPIAERRWHLVGHNHANGVDFDVTVTMVPQEDGGMHLVWDGWLKPVTRIQLETTPQGQTRLVITDDYSSLPETERKARLSEVDSSLLAWGNSLARYLRNWKRFSFLPGYKGFFGRYWLGMTPRARRITTMILIVTVVEFIFFLFVFTIFWLEYGRGTFQGG